MSQQPETRCLESSQPLERAQLRWGSLLTNADKLQAWKPSHLLTSLASPFLLGLCSDDRPKAQGILTSHGLCSARGLWCWLLLPFSSTF